MPNQGCNTTFLQWNIKGLLSNSQELKLLIAEYNPICVSLNETKLNDPTKVAKVSFKNYSPYFIGDHSKDGNLILIRKDIPFTPININTPLNAIAIQIALHGDTMHLCSI